MGVVQLGVVLVQMTLVLVQMGVVQLGVIQLGVVQLGVVQTGVDHLLGFAELFNMAEVQSRPAGAARGRGRGRRALEDGGKKLADGGRVNKNILFMTSNNAKNSFSFNIYILF